MEINKTDNILRLISLIQKIFTAVSAISIFALCVYRGNNSPYGVLIGVLAGLVGAAFIVGSYALFGMWTIATDTLADFLDKYPKFRRGIVSVFSLLVIFIAYLICIYTTIDVIFKAVLIIFFLIIFPPAIFSLIKEERRRESFKLLGNVITPELIAQSPQAAVEHAFTLFEDHLRKKLNFSPTIYGEALINSAFGQDGKLSYSDIENENKGVRNLVSGVYATYRNPRKHRVVEENKESALAIIAVVELLIHIIDESVPKKES